MKKLNRKGFTIIELVIVIAVIAILAAVMVPTFSSIVEKANKSAAQQEAMAYYKEVYALDLSDGTLNNEEGKGNIIAKEDGSTMIDGKIAVYSDGKQAKKGTGKYMTYKVGDNGEITFKFFIENGYKATYENDKWNVVKTEAGDFTE